MQHQICPRCKFRLTNAKAVCNTCGYSLQSARRPVETTPAPGPAPKAAAPHNSNANTSAAAMRKAQSNAQHAGGSFWRTFFGLDPLPAEKAD